MIVAVTILAAVVAMLTVLVLGLLRSHAAILRRLHALDAGEVGASLPVVGPGVVAPTPDEPGRAGVDIFGTAPDGSALSIAVTGVTHDTVVAFLSSSCATCESFWDEFREGVARPEGTRLVIVAKGQEHESPAELAALAPSDVPMVMSSEAWEEYGVPGSPYVVYVEGASSRIRGEGTGGTWAQVAKLLAQSTGDLEFLDGATPRAAKAKTDAERERDTDRALLAAGIRPDDPSLYQRFDEAGADA